MPTAAKLFGAVAFAVVAFAAALAYTPLLPEGTQVRLFGPTSAVIGALVGWFVMGPLAGRGFAAAMGYGVRCSVTVVFWAAILFSGREMVLRSMNRRYQGPMDALVGTFDIMLDYGRLMLDTRVLLVLLVGGALGGMAAEVAARRWR